MLNTPTREKIPKKFRIKTEAIMPGVEVPIGKEIVWQPLWDWKSFAFAAVNLTNNIRFFDLGLEGRDEARTNVGQPRKLESEKTFRAIYFGIYVISTEDSVQSQVDYLRDFVMGMAEIHLGQNTYEKFPIWQCIVADEDGSIGTAASTLGLSKLYDGMPMRLPIPLDLNPPHEFWVELHWETLPELSETGDELEVVAFFSGGLIRPIR